MKYEIHYNDGTWELIRAESIAEAVERSNLEEFITKIEVYR